MRATRNIAPPAEPRPAERSHWHRLIISLHHHSFRAQCVWLPLEGPRATIAGQLLLSLSLYFAAAQLARRPGKPLWVSLPVFHLANLSGALALASGRAEQLAEDEQGALRIPLGSRATHKHS